MVFVFHVREESCFDAVQNWGAEKCIWNSENGLTGGRREMQFQEPYNFHCTQNSLRVMKSRRLSKECDTILVSNLKLWELPLSGSIKHVYRIFRIVVCTTIDWIYLKPKERRLVKASLNLRILQTFGEFIQEFLDKRNYFMELVFSIFFEAEKFSWTLSLPGRK